MGYSSLVKDNDILKFFRQKNETRKLHFKWVNTEQNDEDGLYQIIGEHQIKQRVANL